MASGTSRALPWPKPTRPFWSPTTTSAAKPKFLPPFTTLATRLIATSLSTSSDCSRSPPPPPSRRRPRPRSPRSPRSPPRSPASRAIRVSSEFQSALAGGVGHCFHTAVEQIAAAVEHHVGNAGLLGPFGDELADRRGVFGFFAALEVFLQ